MPRQKKSSKQSEKLKQSTLFGSMSSRSQVKAKVSPRARSHKSKRPAPVSDKEDVSDDTDVGAIKLEPRKSTDEEEAPRSPVKRRKVRVSDSDDNSDDELIIPSANKKKSGSRENVSGGSTLKSRTRQLVLSDSEPEEPPRKRKLVKGVRPVAQDSDEEEDIAEEVEKKHILQNRLRTRDKKTTFQKNLEKLKRKKQGKPMKSSSEENSQDEEDEGEDENAAPFKGAKQDSDRDSLFDDRSDNDEESVGSSDFIVEDDGPALAALPLEFSMETHQDLVHQFKKIFQFFVHIAVRPPVERQAFMAQQMKGEEYFSVPLTVTRRKILGLRDSLVASSVWRPEFKKSLEKYPVLDLVQLDYAIAGCDACHLGARLSTLSGRLIGDPYNSMGFEEKDDSDNSDSSTNVRVEFQLGRFCARRTRVYHDLTHWEYNLFKTINDEVDELHIAEQQNDGGFVRVAWAGGKEPPEDLQDADAICDWLDQRKVIDVEWERLKAVMDSAQHLEVAAKKGADDED